MNEFVVQNVDKIIAEDRGDYPLNFAMAASWIMANFKGLNLKIIDVRGESALTDFFLLGSATNTTQAQAMTGQILEQLKRHGLQSKSKEGMDNSDWILLDMGDIIVHIFQETARDVYDLDGLWHQYPTIEIPKEYMISAASVEPEVDMNLDKADSYF